MSSSSSPRSRPPRRGRGIIDASAPIGVQITVLDGDLTTIETGMGRLHLSLLEGIYAVQWSAIGYNDQKMIRLRAGERVHLQPTALVPSVITSNDEQLSKRQLKKVVRALAEKLDDTELAVFVCADDMRTSSDVARKVELRQADGVDPTVSNLEPFLHDVDNEDGWSILNYRLKPGNYVLRYLSVERISVEQSIYAAPGRRTVAWLRYGKATRTEWRKGKAKLRSFRGIVPGRSQILSFRGSVSEGDAEAAFLLGDAVLDHLGAKTGELEDVLLQAVRKCEDPFMRFYGAAVLLTRPSVPNERWPDDDPTKAMALPPDNLNAARELLKDFPDPAGPDFAWPDLLCANWRIALASGSARRDGPGACSLHHLCSRFVGAGRPPAGCRQRHF